MNVANHIVALQECSRSPDNDVSWPAMRILGLLAERHFGAVVGALESHCGEGCKELRQLARTLRQLESEAGG